jgi:hypothetical protein
MEREPVLSRGPAWIHPPYDAIPWLHQTIDSALGGLPAAIFNVEFQPGQLTIPNAHRGEWTYLWAHAWDSTGGTGASANTSLRFRLNDQIIPGLLLLRPGMLVTLLTLGVITNYDVMESPKLMAPVHLVQGDRLSFEVAGVANNFCSILLGGWIYPTIRDDDGEPGTLVR